jgi:hypothetical protein
VLYGQPIEAVASTKTDWLEQKLSRWTDFVDDVQFHEVPGHHYTLLATASMPTISGFVEPPLVR